MAYVPFNDKSVPLGKRKQAYVKWLMKTHKCSLDEAKLRCYKMFYHEIKDREDKLNQRAEDDKQYWREHE